MSVDPAPSRLCIPHPAGSPPRTSEIDCVVCTPAWPARSRMGRTPAPQATPRLTGNLKCHPTATLPDRSSHIQGFSTNLFINPSSVEKSFRSRLHGAQQRRRGDILPGFKSCTEAPPGASDPHGQDVISLPELQTRPAGPNAHTQLFFFFFFFFFVRSPMFPPNGVIPA